MPQIPDLESLFVRHERVVLAFSGGKDSLVCLHLCRDYRDKIDVCWVNTGAAYPHMVEFVRGATQDFNFVELTSDQGAWIKQHGLPSDIVPVVNSIWRDPGARDAPQTLVKPWTSCCARLRFAPLLEYLARSKATLFIHGQRRSDGGGLVIDSGPDTKAEICKLVWGWSERDVMDYVAKFGIELPEHYVHGVIGTVSV